MKKESTLIGKIREALQAEGWIVIKNHGGPHTIAGLPDIQALRNGICIFMEVKLPSEVGKVTKLQDFWLKRLRSQNFPSEVVTSVRQAKSFALSVTLKRRILE